MDEGILNILLNSLAVYGPPVLGVFVFAIALGLPLPGSAALIAAGALARQDHLALAGTIVAAFLGAALGDSLGFAIGHFASESRRRRWSNHAGWQRVAGLFCRYGVWLILLLRTVLTSITLPVNLAAGVSGLPYRRFLIFDLLGVLLWVACYLGLGYLFAAALPGMIALLKNIQGWVLAVGLLVGAGYWVYRWRKKSH